MSKWIANFRGELEWEIQGKEKVLAYGSEYEYSVIRQDNELGFESFGWGDENKIILFANSTGANSFNPATEKRINFATHVTKLLADALNKEGL